MIQISGTKTLGMAALVVAAVCALSAAPAHAVLTTIGPGDFTPQATTITYDEAGYPVGTINPVYVLPTLDLGAVTVSHGGIFTGQAATGGSPNTLSDTTPTGPLTLDLSDSGNDAEIVLDGAFATSPTLSGTPTFNGPIAVLFDVDVAAVGLDGGVFDAIGGTTIEAFARDGTSLGTVTNSALGVEFFGLADSSGANVIAGISFYITGPEPAGFNIDNLTFGSRSVLNGGIPEPATASLAVMGLLALARRRRRA